MDEVEKKFEDSCVKFRIEVEVPGALTGDDIGAYFTYKQLVNPEGLEYSRLGIEFIVLSTLQQMSRAITDKMVEKLNAKRD